MSTEDDVIGILEGMEATDARRSVGGRRSRSDEGGRHGRHRMHGSQRETRIPSSAPRVHTQMSFEDLPSHGFVEVCAPINTSGQYNVLKRRCLSSTDIDKTNETLFALYRQLQRDVQALEGQVATLRRKAHVNERWEHRYSKRMAVMGNLMLGGWSFFYHFAQSASQHRTALFQAMLPTHQRGGRTSAGSGISIRTVLLEACLSGVKQGWVFIFFAFLLTRPLAWARWLGVVMSSSWSLYLALFGTFLPWTNYFNVLANLLYAVASRRRKDSRRIPTLTQYLRNNPRVVAPVAAHEGAAHEGAAPSRPFLSGNDMSKGERFASLGIPGSWGGGA